MGFKIKNPLGSLGSIGGFFQNLFGSALGINQFEAAREQRKLANMEAYLKSKQVALELERKREFIQDTVEAQKIATISSGFLLEGSPLLHILETKKRGAEDLENFSRLASLEVEFIRRGGKLASDRSVIEGARAFIDTGQRVAAAVGTSGASEGVRAGGSIGNSSTARSGGNTPGAF